MNWSNGECSTTSSAFSVNIGKIILGTSDAAKELKKQYDYFGITLQAASDGTYDKAVISMDHQGQSYALITSSLTLSGGMKQGTFTGKDLKGVSVSGSFTC
jgi:energy-converting hydrogenase Eha subunit F